MIEPAAYGAAVSFGPRTRNFRDVVALMLQEEAAAIVHDGPQLTSFVRRCVVDQTYSRNLGRNAINLVRRQQGAIDRTVTLLEPLIAHLSNDAGPRWTAA